MTKLCATGFRSHSWHGQPSVGPEKGQGAANDAEGQVHDEGNVQIRPQMIGSSQLCGRTLPLMTHPPTRGIRNNMFWLLQKTILSADFVINIGLKLIKKLFNSSPVDIDQLLISII